MCECVSAVECATVVEGAVAVLFICALCCLLRAGGTPGWTCAMAPARGVALVLDRAGVTRRKHGLTETETRKKAP